MIEEMQEQEKEFLKEQKEKKMKNRPPAPSTCVFCMERAMKAAGRGDLKAVSRCLIRFIPVILLYL